MVNKIEIKRMKLEMVKVAAARAEMEFRIEERMEEIARIEDNIKLQDKREQELKEKIAAAEAEV